MGSILIEIIFGIIGYGVAYLVYFHILNTEYVYNYKTECSKISVVRNRFIKEGDVAHYRCLIKILDKSFIYALHISNFRYIDDKKVTDEVIREYNRYLREEK